MTVLLIIAMLAIVFALFAAVGPEGFWCNLITLVNVTFAALVATNAFEPLAARIHYGLPKSSYMVDFLVAWGMFIATYVLLQFVTNRASNVKVRIGAKIDQIGGFALATMTGWVLVCFASMTFHLAPVPREVLGNALMPKFDTGFMDTLSPDRAWLNATQRLSQGNRLGSQDSEEPVFDPQGKFILNYATRRHDNYRYERGLFSQREWGAALPTTKDVKSE